MSADDIVKIITALAALFAAISAGYASYATHQNRTAINDTQAAVRDVHISLNSRLTQLLQATASASRAEGIASTQPSSEVPRL